MKTTPKISVVMSAYNSERTIREAINSVLQQSYRNFEFLIIDDGSSDNTRPIIARFDDPRIKILHNAANIGLTRSLNKGIQLSTGELIARQDADDVSLPERFQKQVEFMQQHPDVVLLGTSRATLDKTGKVIAINKAREEPSYQDLLHTNCFVHGSVMLRRQVLDEAGFYDEFFRQSQDYELWLRIARHHRVMNIQEPLYGVRRHSHRITLTRLPQAMLYRLLAVHLASGLVSRERYEQVKRDGIDSYYDILDINQKLDFRRKAAQKYLKHGLYGEAECQAKELLKLAPCSATAMLVFAWIRLQSSLHRMFS